MGIKTAVEIVAILFICNTELIKTVFAFKSLLCRNHGTAKPILSLTLL